MCVKSVQQFLRYIFAGHITEVTAHTLFIFFFDVSPHYILRFDNLDFPVILADLKLCPNIKDVSVLI